MQFGKNFRDAREQMGFTQSYVAKKLNIHQSNISDWENDVARPDYEKLIELAKIYETTLDDLLGY